MFRSRLNTLRNIWNGRSLNFAVNWRLPLRPLLRSVMPQADDHGELLCAPVLLSCVLFVLGFTSLFVSMGTSHRDASLPVKRNCIKSSIMLPSCG